MAETTNTISPALTQCASCHRELPADQFHWKVCRGVVRGYHQAGRRDSWCKACRLKKKKLEYRYKRKRKEIDELAVVVIGEPDSQSLAFSLQRFFEEAFYDED